MKVSLRSLLALLTMLPAALLAHEKSADKSKNCGCACCPGKEVCCCHEDEASSDPTKPTDAKRYPLKGVIVNILAAQGALLVKHEDIPGFMPAMTMLFKVDEAALQAAQKGQAITGTLVQRGEEYWLLDIKALKQ